MCYGVGEWPPKLSPEAFDVESRFVLDCWDLLALGELADFNLAVFPLYFFHPSGGHTKYSDTDYSDVHGYFSPCTKWLGAINRRQPRLFLSHSQTISKTLLVETFQSALPVFGGATGGSSRDSAKSI